MDTSLGSNLVESIFTGEAARSRELTPEELFEATSRYRSCLEENGLLKSFVGFAPLSRYYGRGANTIWDADLGTGIRCAFLKPQVKLDLDLLIDRKGRLISRGPWPGQIATPYGTRVFMLQDEKGRLESLIRAVPQYAVNLIHGLHQLLRATVESKQSQLTRMQELDRYLDEIDEVLNI